MFSMTREETAARIRYFLEKTGATPYGLDKRGLFPKSTMYRLCDCEVDARDETIKQFCRAIDISIQEFVGPAHAHDLLILSPKQQKVMELVQIGDDSQMDSIINYIKQLYGIL